MSRDSNKNMNWEPDIAKAFDVGLLVRFVSFSELANWTIDVDPGRLNPPSYEQERQLSFGNLGIGPEWPQRGNPVTGTGDATEDSVLRGVESLDPTGSLVENLAIHSVLNNCA